MSSQDRPPVEELELVKEGELIFRFISPKDYDIRNPLGTRVQAATLPSDQLRLTPASYGPSVYVGSRLSRGIQDLYAANPNWRVYYFARMPIKEVSELGIEVRLSPYDCDYPTVKHAHASLTKMDRPKRNKLVSVLERLLEPPAGK